MIGEHPEKVDVRKIKGKRSDYYRIRLDNYRIIYAIIRGKIVVVSTLTAGARGDIYNQMSGM
jgi:mRNA interferase RelE/StbE